MTSIRVAQLSALIQQECYTAEEASDLLGLSVDLVRRAVLQGKLAATIGEQESIQIRRIDMVTWLQRRPYAAWFPSASPW